MSIYQHFRQEEHQFVDQVLGWKEQAEVFYTSELTDYLDPRERQIIRFIIGEKNEEIFFHFFGGDSEAERKRAIIAPYYQEIKTSDYEIVLLEAKFAKKFISLTHGDVMGSFMGLGLDRKKMGDIIVGDDKLQLYTTKDLSTYILANLTSINRANIQFEEKQLGTHIVRQDIWKEQSHSVSSMRLDVLIKEIYRMSRTKAAELITRKQVKVNFKEVNDSAMILMEADLISVRNYGRCRIIVIGGKSKKDRTFITAAVLKT